MSYIQSAYINALLADAAYIDLPVGAISRDQWEDPKKRGTFKTHDASIGKIHSRQFRSHQQ